MWDGVTGMLLRVMAVSEHEANVLIAHPSDSFTIGIWSTLYIPFY